MPEELPENRLQRVPPVRFEAVDWLPNGKRRKATSFAPDAQPVHIPADLAPLVADSRRQGKPCHYCGGLPEEGHAADCSHNTRRPPAGSRPVNLYVKPKYNTRWPTAELVARLICAAGKITGESPYEMYSGKGITTNISRWFVGNLLRQEFNLSAKAAAGLLGVSNGSSASAIFVPSFGKERHAKHAQAMADALGAVLDEFR